MRVAGVVVNWNRPEDTLECLAALAGQEQVQLDLVVVDNASQDDSVRKIGAAYPQAHIIANPVNTGFGAGTNQGVRYAFENGAELVFTINNDAYVAPDALRRLTEQDQEGTGLLAPLIFYAGQPEVIWAAGGKVSRWNLEVRGELRGRRVPAGLPEVIEQDFLTGCALLITRAAFEATGLFDENFRMYYEDSDLSRRVWAAGLKQLVVRDARAWHKVSASSGGSGSPNERYWMARSSIRFFRKHARPWQWPFILITRLGSAIKTTLRLLGQRRGDSARAYLRGLKDGLLER